MSKEQTRFDTLMRKALSVPPEEMKRRLDTAKQEKNASGAKRYPKAKEQGPQGQN